MENKKIYAFDFDGTIVTNEFPKIGKPIHEVIDMIHEVKKQGHYIILYTMREDERLREALDFCRSYRIFFDAVNDNLPHMKEFYKNNPRKIFANYYIDDHNMGLSAVNEDYAMLEQQLKAKDKVLDKEEQYKLALFMVARNSQVMPKGIERGMSMKQINQMSINACENILSSIDFNKARKEYDNGID